MFRFSTYLLQFPHKIDANSKIILIDSEVRIWLVNEASNLRTEAEERGRGTRRGWYAKREGVYSSSYI